MCLCAMFPLGTFIFIYYLYIIQLYITYQRTFKDVAFINFHYFKHLYYINYANNN